MQRLVRDANGVTGEVISIDADLTFANFRRMREDGTHYWGEECHLTKELTFCSTGPTVTKHIGTLYPRPWE